MDSTQNREREEMDRSKIDYLRSNGRWRKLAGLVADRDEETRMITASIMQKLNPRWGKVPVNLTLKEETLLEELYEQLHGE